MRELTLREFIKEWDVDNAIVRLREKELIKLLDEDESGKRFLVRGRFETLLHQFPRVFLEDAETGEVVLFQGDELLHIRIKDWKKARRHFIYFILEERWDEDNNCDWYVKGTMMYLGNSLRLTKPRG